jgi:rhomboid family GlyGly-CTERM serine protease
MIMCTLSTTLLKLISRIPMTLSLGILAVVIAGVPSAAEMLQLDRAALQAGELWRLATCHVTHWNAEHLQWDLAMFLVLGTMCELRNARRMWLCTVLATACVSGLVFFMFPGIAAYRGLSGIDTALFTLLAFDLLRDARHQHSWLLAAATGGLLFGFIAKTTYEAVTGQALFVDQHSAGFVVLVWDHVIASAVGAVVAMSRERDLIRTDPLRVAATVCAGNHRINSCWRLTTRVLHDEHSRTSAK